MTIITLASDDSTLIMHLGTVTPATLHYYDDVASARLASAVAPLDTMPVQVSSANSYLPGQSIQLTLQVQQDGGNANPESCLLKIKPASGSTLTPTPTGDDDGGFVYTLALADNAASGWWYYRWETLSPTGASEGRFYVTASNVL